jgi:DNA-binding NtrC family response regulator
MRAHAWPGNVRELGHAIERAVLFADPDATAVRARDLALGPAAKAAAEQSLEDAERVVIEKALARHAGDVRAAAAQLGLSRSALYRRLQAYGLRGQQ